MPVIPQTRLHRVYLVERWGDTLVVVPKGDAAGFSVSSVNTEMASIMGLAESGLTKHLVVDLKSGNYFGSVVLGALIQLGNTVRARGGRIALCGASTDMQDILRLMKLDQMWEMFADRGAALRAIAKIPVREQLWAQRRKFAWLITLTACWLLYWYLPRPKAGREYYETTNELWREVLTKYDMAGEDEWSRLKKKCENRLTPIIADLEKADKRRVLKDAEPFVLTAIRDYWPSTMERRENPKIADNSKRMVQYFLRCAEARLENRPLPSPAGVFAAGGAADAKPSPESQPNNELNPSATTTLPGPAIPNDAPQPTPEAKPPETP
ncbi:STAS domain-containing protein [bacterium]|nr:STAS domain-containing protein [bacterium]